MIHFVSMNDSLRVNDKNQFFGGNNGVRPSDNWRLIGAVERNNFGRIVRVYSPNDIRDGLVPWFFKNRKQRCFVRDYDHGTIREWRSPKLLYVTVTKEAT